MDGAEGNRWRGGLFARGVQGRQPAWIAFSSTAFVADTDDGTQHTIPASEARLEQGGASGRMLFIHNHDRSLTFCCEDRILLMRLQEKGPHVLRKQLDQLATAGKRRLAVGWGILLGLLGLVLVLAMFAPALLRALASAAVETLPMSVDEAIGRAAFNGMDLGGPEITDPEALEALQAMLDRLGPHAERRDVGFRVHLVMNPQVNAFALPGGEMVVFTGLIEKAKNGGQVAGVIAHEMAHVTRRHGLKRMAESLGVIAAVQLIFGDATGLLAIGKELFTLAAVNNYSREAEAEADAEAVDLMMRAGLDPGDLAGFFQLIKNEGGSMPGALAWLSTHPDPLLRIAAVRERMQKRRAGRRVPLDLDWPAVQARVKEAALPAGRGAETGIPTYPKEGTTP